MLDKHQPAPLKGFTVHPKLVSFKIVFERRSGIENSSFFFFEDDLSPYTKRQQMVISRREFWLVSFFGIFHPELNKHVEDKDHVRPSSPNPASSLGGNVFESDLSIRGVG